ncbi:hypothetical protein SynPROS91_02378 [Synechococcus sp. PROS-9-1]|nr:hypothetical protein SynPROS91_02378 [Synechococcus sp. PROS-9-1]
MICSWWSWAVGGFKELLAQLMLLQQLAEAQVRFFLLMIKKSFLVIFMRVKYEFLEALQVKTQKKGPCGTL